MGFNSTTKAIVLYHENQWSCRGKIQASRILYIPFIPAPTITCINHCASMFLWPALFRNVSACMWPKRKYFCRKYQAIWMYEYKKKVASLLAHWNLFGTPNLVKSWLKANLSTSYTIILCASWNCGTQHRGPFRWHDLILIPAWISNHILIKSCDASDDPYPNCTFEIWIG